MKKICLKIEGMSCSACSNGLEKHLNKHPKINDAIVNLITGEATIYYEEELTIKELEDYIKTSGFTSLGEATSFDIVKNTKKEKNNLIILGINLILVMYLSMGHMLNIPIIINKEINPNLYVSILFLLTIITLILSKDILKNGYKNLRNKMPNMDSLVSIGVLASLLISTTNMIRIFLNIQEVINNLYFESVTMILFFIKLGRFIDKNSKAKTVSAIEELVQITPEKALLKVGNKEQEVTIDEIKVGDILIAKPGMKIAVDGNIIKGTTHLDETFITGESLPIKKKIGDSVIAGSLNYHGVIEYTASKIGKNSTISEIVHLVVDATNTKARIARVVDKISSYFVPVLLIIATITFIIHLLLGNSLYNSLETFITILVVACPCALGLATPLAIVVAEGLSAKNGILIKSSEILENASLIDTIIFDKTGTLTKGELEISEIITDHNEKELLKIVASIESNSTHPIRNAFLNYVKNKKLSLLNIKNFKNLDGIGITAQISKDTYYLGNNKLFKNLNISNPYQEEERRLRNNGNSIVYVIENNKAIALIGIKDKVKKESQLVISKLKQQNKQVIMLTGDNKEVADLVAKELGVTEVYAEVMPKDKRNIISKLKKQGKKVMMIGDGINDAPSLALADIGISFKGATDIATNSADVILLRNDLTSIIDLVIISKETLKKIYQNLFWAFFYNVIMIIIATGLLAPLNITLNPMLASIAMTISSLTIVYNTLRLKKKRK